MSRDFTQVIRPTMRAGVPLTVTVTATVGDAGSLDRWGLAINSHPQSVANRDTLRRMLRGVCRDTVSGDNIGAEWETPDRLRIWDADRHWSLTAKHASSLCDQIERTIGRWCEAMEPVREAVAAVTAAQTWGQPDEILAATRPPPLSPAEVIRASAGGDAGGDAGVHKMAAGRQTNPPAPVVLEWDDLTPYQQKMVLEGRKGTMVPATVRSGEEFPSVAPVAPEPVKC